MDKNTKIWIWVIVAVVIIGGIIAYVMMNNNSSTSTVTTGTDNTTVVNEPAESQQDVAGQTGVGAVSISYADALVKYADRRIQLDKTCQAHPTKVTYKDNTGIMIDNRSPQTVTVKVGTSFTIQPWGFKIVVLPDTYLASKTLLVDCNARQNVATILIQE